MCFSFFLRSPNDRLFEALKRKILVVFLQISANFKTGRSRPVGQNWRAKTAFLLGVLRFFGGRQENGIFDP